MAIPTLNYLPDSFEAGDTILFSENFGDYPAGTWTAKVYFSLNGAPPTNATATASGTGFLFTLSSIFTAALSPGGNLYAIKVTSGSEQVTVKTGIVNILPNLTAAQTPSDAATQLAAANTALATLVASPDSSVSFNGQSYTEKNQMELFRIIQRLKAVVQAERDEQAALRGDSLPRCMRPYFQ
jgi:hypothetical protein